MKKKNEDNKLERTAKRLMRLTSIQDLSYLYPVEIFPNGNELILEIQLNDLEGKLVDIIEIPANSNGFVDPEIVLDKVAHAFECC